ncbi:MAG: BMP family ABC transporter substrate-binding protein [Acholeplasmataceae bacterium]|nr:BMP family ABC transporter substrate-binding protein [Acholeplasmataceae bacterium]
MKKALLVIALVFASVFTMASCAGEKYEIAMVTDSGGIDDKSFNQSTWEGIVEYATANEKSYKYYKPREVSDKAYLRAIKLAVRGGAKIVVTPGYLFETAIYKAQSLYPDVKFVLIDGEPHTADYGTYKTEENTLNILFDEHEVGFLAGYVAVKSGKFTNLGFFGGMSVPAVQRFGIGYVAGAYYAADEMDKQITFTADHYEYLGSFAPTPDAQSKATAWYSAGVEVIFAAAGGAGSSAMSAAEEQTDKWVIGVDADQSGDSTSVITSALKGVGEAAIAALEDFYGDTWDGGRTISLGAAEGGVSLPADFSRFGTHEAAAVAAYQHILPLVVDGTIVVPTNDKSSLGAFLQGLGVSNADLVAKAEPAEDAE